MAGESGSVDLKLTLNLDDPRASLDLVKDLVALANTGGGEIWIGCSEVQRPGVSLALAKELDGAKVSDLVNRYIAPSRASVSHSIEEADQPGAYIVKLRIERYHRYPFVFSRSGDGKGIKRPLFRVGQIYVRHGAKNEVATHCDLSRFIETAVQESRGPILESLLRKLEKVARLPDGVEPILVGPDGGITASPSSLINLVVARRSRGDREAILTGRDLLWCLSEWPEFETTSERISLLIRSALRRTPTLYFWLAETSDRSLVEDVLESTIEDRDRDKSDAKDAVLEVGSLIASDECLERLVAAMRKSRYQHFRTAASRFSGRQETVVRFLARAKAATIQGRLVHDLNSDEITRAGQKMALEILATQSSSTVLSRSLGDLGRALWLKTIYTQSTETSVQAPEATEAFQAGLRTIGMI
ncbi:MAG: ATP-binding protein [Firmicutes bacterium]|mgnify:CR=1 FL=1|nr:ATP-binding protein [Bacillota bacterium]